MKRFLFLALAVLMSGCVNLYIRSPFTDAKVERPWQSTSDAASFSYVVMFPQVLSPGSDKGFMAANLISVPAGCLLWIDVACEAVIDTLLWPIDSARQHMEIAL